MKNLITLSIYLLPVMMISCSFEGLPQKTDRMIREYRAADRFSGTVLIAHEGNIIFNQGFGYLDREQKIPNVPQTRLKIGSIVKDFTAVTILRLMEQNKLNLDDTIGKYQDDMFPPEINNAVTIRQLLRHESGFGDYLMQPEFRNQMQTLKSVPQIIALFREQPLLFEPGTRSEYSNSGYTVLGAIIESITGVSYFEAVKQEILNPLGMNETVFDWQEIDRFEHNPKWYMRSSTGKFIISPFDEWPSPSGGAYSTGSDLLKFESSLLNDNRLISDASKVLLANRFRPDSGSTWQDIINNPDVVSTKAGGSPGTNAVIISDFGWRYIIIVLANYDEPIAEVIGDNIHSLIVSGEYVPPQPDIFEQTYLIYKNQGIDSLASRFSQLAAVLPEGPPPDMILNRVGYDLLSEDRITEAIEIFTLNTRFFPHIANTWDSLGEACLKNGNKLLAKKHYTKALELDPANQNVRRILDQLNAED